MSPRPGAMTGAAAVSDEELGRQALAGERDAFAALFCRHEAGLYDVAHRLTGSRDDAADVTQEAFLRVFARLDEPAGRKVSLAAFLHRAARKLVDDRSAPRAREAPTEQLEWAAGADEAMEADPHLSTLVSAQGRDVQAANARLPERRRMVLALRELEDMSDEDTGRVEIGALIDGELDPDRAQVLTAHLASCDACRAARASFEDARVTYRAWLPLPVLGLGDATARAAAARSGALLGRPTAAPGLAGRGARRHDRTGRAGARARDDDRGDHRRDDGRGLHAGAPPPPAPPPPVIE